MTLGTQVGAGFHPRLLCGRVPGRVLLRALLPPRRRARMADAHGAGGRVYGRAARQAAASRQPAGPRAVRRRQRAWRGSRGGLRHGLGVHVPAGETRAALRRRDPQSWCGDDPAGLPRDANSGRSPADRAPPGQVDYACPDDVTLPTGCISMAIASIALPRAVRAARRGRCRGSFLSLLRDRGLGFVIPGTGLQTGLVPGCRETRTGCQGKRKV